MSDWRDLTDASLDDLESRLRELFTRIPTAATPNESQTEDDLVWPAHLVAAVEKVGRIVAEAMASAGEH